jgi:hypothetical protein
VGSRIALCGRSRLSNPERALYFGRLRNAFSNTHSNSDGYTDRNANTNSYCESECNTQPHPHCDSFIHTYFYAAVASHTTAAANSKTFRDPITSYFKTTIYNPTP